jgi:hypothetical protein
LGSFKDLSIHKDRHREATLFYTVFWLSFNRYNFRYNRKQQHNKYIKTVKIRRNDMKWITKLLEDNKIVEINDVKKRRKKDDRHHVRWNLSRSTDGGMQERTLYQIDTVLS